MAVFWSRWLMLPQPVASKAVSKVAGIERLQMLVEAPSRARLQHLLAAGALAHSIEAKVFGGGNVMNSLNHANVGKRNACVNAMCSSLKTANGNCKRSAISRW